MKHKRGIRMTRKVNEVRERGKTIFRLDLEDRTRCAPWQAELPVDAHRPSGGANLVSKEGRKKKRIERTIYAVLNKAVLCPKKREKERPSSSVASSEGRKRDSRMGSIGTW